MFPVTVRVCTCVYVEHMAHCMLYILHMYKLYVCERMKLPCSSAPHALQPLNLEGSDEMLWIPCVCIWKKKL